VVLNPVRAGLVAEVLLWPWSSYPATAGLAGCPAWLAADAVLALFGHDVADARDRYREFVAQGTGRPAPWKNLAGQMHVFLGNEAFLKRMQGMAASHSSANVPRAQRLPVRPSPDAILQTVATAHNLPKEKVLDRSSSGRAFKLAVYLLRRRGNLALREVAALAGVSVSRVSQIQAEIEAEETDGRPADVLTDVN
jgi:putative transposase